MTNTCDLQKDVQNSLQIYQQLIGANAARTKAMIHEHGEVDAISRLVQSTDPQSGFIKLRDAGKLDSTFEAIVLRHQPLFSKESIEYAQFKMDNPRSS